MMKNWLQRIFPALTGGVIGAVCVPFLCVEVYRLLLSLGADNYEILIRLTLKTQTPAAFFAQQTVVFGAVLGVGSGYMCVLRRENRARAVWVISLICGFFALLFLYSLVVHPLYVLLQKESADALPLALTLFLVPALWSFFLLWWGYKVHGAAQLAARKWNRKEEVTGAFCALVFVIFQAILE